MSVHFLDHRLCVVGCRVIPCETDAAARAFADGLLAGTAHPAIEVWQGQRAEQALIEPCHVQSKAFCPLQPTTMMAAWVTYRKRNVIDLFYESAQII